MNTIVENEWIIDFEASKRRSLRERMKYSFVYTYKPIMDDVPFRTFKTIEEYKTWCKTQLPSWLGYGKTL